jgi:alpha-L-fucosidase
MTMNRRTLLRTLAVAPAAVAAAGVPSYLESYRELYARDPHAAAIEWFKNARFGLFMHYGLYSLLGGEWQGKPMVNENAPERPNAEWIQFNSRIPVAEYARLKDRFTAARFDAHRITDLALAAGMKYVNITTRHHDSFCLFRTQETDFNSVNSAARRDLVAELAEQCRRKKLGLFLYYSHGRDWKHPHAPTLEWAGNCRPHYDKPQPEYIPDSKVDVRQYAAFMERQITELLTRYGPIAGIWLDGEGVLKQYAKKRPGGLPEVAAMLRLNELYVKIRALQPQCLISYKQGVTMTEDFLTPERKSFGLESSGKPLEINTTLQPWSWGYNKFTVKWKGIDEIAALAQEARSAHANLLLNVGPAGDGGIVPQEEALLREMGRKVSRTALK